MNDQVLNELKRVVERAVRPVRAGDLRKLRMREELLDHLTAIYEEELQRLGEPMAAIAQARERFGDPGLLTDELRGAVSGLEYIRYVLDRYRYRPGEPLLGFALRHLLLSSVAMVVMFLIVLPLTWMRGRFGEIGILLHVGCVTVLFSAGFSCAFTFLAEQMGQILYGLGSQARVRAIVRYSMVSLLVFPIVTALTYGGLMLSLESALRGFLLGWMAAPATPVFFLLLGRAMKDQISRENQWAGIEIGE
jgi:hypothetical protein